MTNLEDEFLIPLYQKFPIKVVSGNGASVYDEKGREYIDLSGGYGVAIVGHSNPAVADALRKQAGKLVTCHGSLYNDAREDYLSLLSKHLPSGLTKVYFSNSGTEANEAALKFARKATGRKNILAFAGSYHGKTYGALSATWNQKYKKPFEPLLDGFKFSPYGDLVKAKEVIDASTAAVIVEPIQGEGGIHVPPDDFLPGLRELTQSKGAILIFDEVQSGFGRTGKLWAGENWGVSPDIMTASKGIAGGVPFSITATTESVAAVLKPGEHTSTFGGNPLACSAAKAALGYVLSQNLLQKAVADGDYFRQKLEMLHAKHPTIIREVRGKGLMLAAELKFPVKDVIIKGFEHSLLLLYAGLNILRFLPPLVITRSQIDTVARELDGIFSEIERNQPVKTEESVALS